MYVIVLGNPYNSAQEKLFIARYSPSQQLQYYETDLGYATRTIIDLSCVKLKNLTLNKFYCMLAMNNNLMRSIVLNETITISGIQYSVEEYINYDSFEDYYPTSLTTNNVYSVALSFSYTRKEYILCIYKQDYNVSRYLHGLIRLKGLDENRIFFQLIDENSGNSSSIFVSSSDGKKQTIKSYNINYLQLSLIDPISKLNSLKEISFMINNGEQEIYLSDLVSDIKPFIELLEALAIAIGAFIFILTAIMFWQLFKRRLTNEELKGKIELEEEQKKKRELEELMMKSISKNDTEKMRKIQQRLKDKEEHFENRSFGTVSEFEQAFIV